MKNKELKVMTDCGEITVQAYDDEVANGVKIFLGDTIVAMVDCYRKVDSTLPSEVCLAASVLNTKEEPDETIKRILFNLYDVRAKHFYFGVDGKFLNVRQIEWEDSKQPQQKPEARLLVYGPDGPDFDEPTDCIRLN